MSNVADILCQQALRRPEAAAITQRRGRGELTVTYGGLEARVAAEARRLAESGLGAGDRVLVLCPVGIELYVAVLGLLRRGCVATFIDPGAGLWRVGACCAVAKPKAVIASRRARLLRLLVRPLWFGVRWLSAARFENRDPAGGDSPPPAVVSPDHPALLTFTSGSTGEPKGVVRTHGFLAVQRRALARDLGLAAGQTDLSTMPMFVLANLAAGVHSVIAEGDLSRPGAIDAGRIIEQIIRHRPDRMLGSPALLERVAERCVAEGVRLDSLRRVDTGGGPVFERTMDKLRLAMPAARLVAVYGSTEAEPIALLDASRPDAGLRRRTAAGAGLPAGRIAPDLEVRLLRASWGERVGPFTPGEFAGRCVRPGCVGEIVVCGERVVRGYVDEADQGRTKFRVGGAVWHRTGDLGRFDEEGRLWLLGRASARVRDGRGVIEPLAVEAAAMEHAAVARCALMGAGGQRVLAVEAVRGAGRLWPDELLRRLRWAGIDRVMRVRRVPLDRRHNAKIDYPAMRRLLAANDKLASLPAGRLFTVPPHWGGAAERVGLVDALDEHGPASACGGHPISATSSRTLPPLTRPTAARPTTAFKPIQGAPLDG